MAAGYNGSGFIPAGFAAHLDIKLFRDILLQRYIDAFFADKAFSLFYGGRIAVFQHFQLILRLAYQRSQGYSYGQSNHTCAGNAHSHCVFQDIGTQQDIYFLRLCTQGFGCFRHT